jgi:hypothetical protein
MEGAGAGCGCLVAIVIALVIWGQVHSCNESTEREAKYKAVQEEQQRKADAEQRALQEKAEAARRGEHEINDFADQYLHDLQKLIRAIDTELGTRRGQQVKLLRNLTDAGISPDSHPEVSHWQKEIDDLEAMRNRFVEKRREAYGAHLIYISAPSNDPGKWEKLVNAANAEAADAEKSMDHLKELQSKQGAH